MSEGKAHERLSTPHLVWRKNLKGNVEPIICYEHIHKDDAPKIVQKSPIAEQHLGMPLMALAKIYSLKNVILAGFFAMFLATESRAQADPIYTGPPQIIEPVPSPEPAPVPAQPFGPRCVAGIVQGLYSYPPADALVVRAGPGQDFPPVAYLAEGILVEVCGSQFGWGLLRNCVNPIDRFPIPCNGGWSALRYILPLPQRY